MAGSLSSGSAIEQFCILAKSSKGRAAVSLVQQATSSPQTFFFGELLDCPNIQALEHNPETKPAWSLLHIFAYGTYQEYKACAATVGQLTEAQLAKLKILTIVSLSAKSKVLPYSLLQQQLEIASVRALEDLIIEGMYNGLFKGKLDQAGQQFQISEAVGRDCQKSEVGEMIEVLKSWRARSAEILTCIDDNIRHAASAEEAEQQHQREFENCVEMVKKNLQAQMQAAEIEGGGRLPAKFEASEYYDEENKRPKSRPKTNKHLHMNSDHRSRH
eukprot:CAMPEP_0114548950 /NCGR_PEP_ID=MMETSP0114-20121206/5261_1 /TAXON_ID=31324 /ORGANISM="Goniomonas sp, Strain m" /LENGTH=272 /DNA_ID=CAMNT_0001733587 /DNA_START=9 /DNA_END=827 /DNA_ORIENTATION=-